MSRKEIISNLFTQKRETPPALTTPKADTDRVRSGAIGAMSASLKEMAESAKHANELQKQMAGADSVLELDPSLIEPSRIADRITISVDPAFDALCESIRENGQQVPILVRPSPTTDGRYQIAYGRRRLAAARTLGIKVRAVIKGLSDAELIVAQGRENLDRQDLSFIEKAFFAKNMEDEGIERSTIISALGMHKADVSRLLTVAKSVPVQIIERIGAAPKAGRKRWLELLEKLADVEALNIAEDFLSNGDLSELDSDKRFSQLMLRLRTIGKSDTSKEIANSVSSWRTENNSFRVTVSKKPRQVDVSFESESAQKFGDWLSGRLDELVNEFEQSMKNAGD
ncbi:ParB family chromosome partitioning protein [Ochrobactrum anthropi]|uniref:plasmid partitioning protein RepB n=1 Tax=Brucella anthropi TaxID=529 RepID=UPI0015F8637B|nr:plasmid partitioning protein RepB [Brucella anthropi]MBA8862757.1 ParB family chromosome partitioning protein [Brucella anthropi]